MYPTGFIQARIRIIILDVDPLAPGTNGQTRKGKKKMDAENFQRFEAFLFDMDGVITDSMPNHFEAWRRIFEKIGISVSRNEILRREGERGMVTLESITARSGLTLPRKQLSDLLLEKEALFSSLPRPALFPGAEELITDLSRRGKKLALVTGTSLAEAQGNLPPDLFDCFHTVVSGDLVCWGKPDPEPYLRAVNALRILPREALVIENAPFGIQSAREAGLCCVALTTSLPAKNLEGADRIVGDMQELRALLIPG
jgi:beta-phosphoglucomutase